MTIPQQTAIAVAKTSKHPKVRLGAVLVIRNKIVSTKTNMMILGNRGLCAEQHVLKNPPRTAYRGGILYVARVLRDDSLALAKPCPLCLSLIKHRHIKIVYYTTCTGWEKLNIN